MHARPDILNANTTPFHHVNKSAWRRDQKVTATSEVPYLSTNVSATIDDTRPNTRSIGKLNETASEWLFYGLSTDKGH